MERKVYVCDVCGTEQAGTNHWFAIGVEDRKLLRLVPLAEAGRIAGLGYTVLHMCGEACVIRKVNEYVGGFK